MDVHDIEVHRYRLKRLCRICGGKSITRDLERKKHGFTLCKKYKESVLKIYGIDISSDSDLRESTTMCRKCYSRLSHLVNKGKNVTESEINMAKSISESSKSIWVEYNPNLSLHDCNSCGHSLELDKGRVSRTKSNVSMKLTSSMQSLSTSLISDTSINDKSNAFTDDVTKVSPEKNMTPDFPQLQVFTVQIKSFLDIAFQSPSSDTVITSASSRELPQTVPLPSSKCLSSQATAPLPPSALTPPTPSTSPPPTPSTSPPSTSTCSAPSPPSTCLCNRITFCDNKDVLKIKNLRGKPTVYKRITSQYKSSSVASLRTIRRRSQKMSAFRKLLGGDSQADIKVQSLSDFKRQPKAVQSDIMNEMDVKVEIDAASTVALQQYVNLSGEQLAKVKRFHKGSHKVQYASKDKCKEFSKKLIEGKVNVTHISESTETPNGKKEIYYRLGHVPDLEKFVVELLDALETHGKLTWHGEDGIPEDEIWVKLGGDHGKGSMKMCVQIANVAKPNARENTHTVAWVHAKDSHEILKIMCIYLNPELKKLKKRTWRGRKFRIFLFGDYLFLCVLYMDFLVKQANTHVYIAI